MKKTNRYLRTLLVLVIAFVITGAAYAFTAGGTAPGTHASLDTNTITAENVSTATYGLLASDPTKIDTVTLTFASGPPTGVVKAQLTATGSWYDCGAFTGLTTTCTVAAGSETTVLAADNLTVVATD